MKKIQFTIEGSGDFEIKIKVNENGVVTDVPALHSAAIATALQMYYGDSIGYGQQTTQFKTIDRKQSPWSSKVFGFNNLHR